MFLLFSFSATPAPLSLSLSSWDPFLDVSEIHVNFEIVPISQAFLLTPPSCSPITTLHSAHRGWLAALAEGGAPNRKGRLQPSSLLLLPLMTTFNVRCLRPLSFSRYVKIFTQLRGTLVLKNMFFFFAPPFVMFLVDAFSRANQQTSILKTFQIDSIYNVFLLEKSISNKLD